MAFESELTTWLLKKADQLNLRVKRLTWPQEWGASGLFDSQASIEIDGRQIVGRGVSVTEENSIVKACAEALERAFCLGHGLHSTGIAVHSDRSKAQENARDELLERSVFFAHFYSRTPFIPLRHETTAALEARFVEIFNYVRGAGGRLRFYGTKTTENRVGVLALADLNGLPAALGLAAKSSIEDSITQAFFECVSSLSFQMSLPKPKTIATAAFLELVEQTPFDRQSLLRDPAYWAENKFLFEDCRPLTVEKAEPTNFNCELNELSPPFSILTGAPIFAYRARPIVGASPDRIEAGDVSGLSWLSQVWGREIELNSSALRPHFLG